MPTLHQQRKKAKLLSDKSTAATVLLGIVLQEYGDSVFEWYPQTLRREIKDDFNIKIPPSNLSKIYSAILFLKNTDNFHNFVHFHNDIILGINGHNMQPTFWIPPTVEEILWGAFETLLLADEPIDLENRFSYEVNYYVCKSLAVEAYPRLPPIFESVGYKQINQVFSENKFNYSSVNELNIGLFDTSYLESELSVDFGVKLIDFISQIDDADFFPGNKKTAETLMKNLYKFVEPVIAKHRGDSHDSSPNTDQGSAY